MLESSLLPLLASLSVLVVSGRLIIRFLTKITLSFGISEFTVAFILLALATSMPDLFVAVSSSFKQADELILSTVLGANIVNMTLIIGLTAIFSGGIPTTNLHLRRNLVAGSLITLLPLFFLLNGTISQIEGAIMVFVFSLYLTTILRDQILFASSPIPGRLLVGAGSVVVVLLVVVIMVYAADRTVLNAVKLAGFFGIPTFFVGIFALALGTSLPELITTVQSSTQGKPAIALGNIIGTSVANSALILGVASTIAPIQAQGFQSWLLATMFFVVASVALLSYLAIRKNDLSVSDGFMLIACFLIFGFVILSSGLPEMGLLSL